VARSASKLGRANAQAGWPKGRAESSREEKINLLKGQNQVEHRQITENAFVKEFCLHGWLQLGWDLIVLVKDDRI
jgi:hypothetical protein